MKESQRVIFWGFVFTAILLLAFALFAARTTQLTSQDIKNRLIESAGQDVDAVKKMFERDLQTLEAMSQYWADEKNLTSSESLAYLKNIANNTNYTRMALDLPDGSSFTSDGYQVDVADFDYFSRVMQGKNVLTELFSSQVDGNAIFALVVPVYRDGQVVAALRGLYQGQVLENVVNLRSFEGQGYFNLVTADGDFLMRAAKVQRQYSESNLFDVLQEASFRQSFSMDAIRQDLKDGKSAFTVYSLLDEERYAYYTPIGIGEWYLFSVVPSAYIAHQKSRIDHAALLLLGVLLILFVAMMWLVLWQKRRTERLVRSEKAYLERVLDNIPLPMFIANSDMGLSFVNAAACRMFGDNAQLIGKPCSVLGTTICETADCAICKMERTGTNQTSFNKDDQHYIVHTSVLSEEPGGYGKYIEIIQDISEIIQTKQELEKKTLELETVSQNLTGGLLITSLSEGFPILQCNEGYLTLVGGKEEDVLGTPAIHRIAPEDYLQTQEMIRQQLSKNNNVSLEHRLERFDGKQIWVSLHGRRAKLQDKIIGIWMLNDITGIKEAEGEIRISEERYRIAMQNTADIIIDYNVRTGQMHHSSKVSQIYAVEECVENAPQSILDSGVIMEESAQVFLSVFEKIRQGETTASCIIKTKAADGHIIWARLSFTTILDSQSVPVRAIGIMEDISKEKEAELQYKREAYYRKLSGSAAVFYYDVDLTHHRFLSGHESITKEYCEQENDDFDVVTELLLEKMVFEPDRELVRSHINWDALTQSFEQGITKTTFEYRRSLNGEPSWVECALHCLMDEDTGVLRCMGCIMDIDAAKRQELELRRKAERDLLTGLYNKVTAEQLIKEFTDQAQEHAECGAFYLIDLDSFKQINDLLGHAYGDAVLIDVAARLHELFGASDIVGRIGGDEFVVFLRNCAALNAIEQHAQRISDMFHTIYTGKDQMYKVSGSIGVSICPQDGAGFLDLYKNADSALYRAKRSGKDQYCLFRNES